MKILEPMKKVITLLLLLSVTDAMNKIVFIVGMCCVFGALAQHAIPNNMETGNNMAGTMDLNTVMKTFDPKVVTA